ncbi:MAG: hypothetical protein WAU75_22175 [Solirubrobacteraceae bacterium]
MSLDDVDRPSAGAVPVTEVIHRRWVLSKRADDGRPLLIREDKVVHPSGFARARRTTVTRATDTSSGTPALS